MEYIESFVPAEYTVIMTPVVMRISKVLLKIRASRILIFIQLILVAFVLSVCLGTDLKGQFE